MSSVKEILGQEDPALVLSEDGRSAVGAPSRGLSHVCLSFGPLLPLSFALINTFPLPTARFEKRLCPNKKDQKMEEGEKTI